MHLAMINIARARYPMDDPRMSGFVDNLNVVNAAADRSPGFIWRLVGEDPDSAIDIRAFDDPAIIINMSVWQDIATLEDYTYRTIHKRVFGKRSDWFERIEGPSMALWWIKKGTLPTPAEGRNKLEELAANGPASSAFTFGDPFDPRGNRLTDD